MTNPERVPVTVAVPVFGTPAALLDSCLRSIAAAERHSDQLFVVVDGPQSPDVEEVISAAGRYGFSVVRQIQRIGLVANWNACLQLGSHDFVHVMHADDVLDPRFYTEAGRAIGSANVAAVAAGRALIPTSGVPVLTGQEAARYLLSDHKPPTGSFVLRRSALGTPVRGFDARLPYCPDEELFLRIVASGDLALVDEGLYVQSHHEQQARYATWHRADFADVYYAARIEGAREVDTNLASLARRQTTLRLMSVGRFLCEAGDGRAARRVVRSITTHDKSSMLTWKYWALVLLAVTTHRRRRSMATLGPTPTNEPRPNP